MFSPQQRLPSPGFFAGLGAVLRAGKRMGKLVARTATGPRVMKGQGFRKPKKIMRAVMGRNVGTMKPFFARRTSLSAYLSEAEKPKTELMAQGALCPSTMPNFGALNTITRRIQTLKYSPARVPVRGFAKRAKLHTAAMFSIIPSTSIPGRYQAELPNYLTQVETIGFVAAPVGTLRRRGLDAHTRQGTGGFLRSRLSR